MGISASLIPLLLDCIRAHHLGGGVLMLGRQTVEIDVDGFAALLLREQFSPALNPAQSTCEAGRVTPESFFHTLGFATVESLDFDDREGAGIVLDLNCPVLPSNLVGRYDVLFDGGTLEHVFHLPNALVNCGGLLRDGGHFVHIGPMNGYVDHGFYQFSPTFWFDWAAANGWSVMESVMARLPSRHRREPPYWRFSFLPPGLLGTVGELDDGPCLHCLIIRKEAGAPSDRIPVQRIYAGGSVPRDTTTELREFAPFAVSDIGRRRGIAATGWTGRVCAALRRGMRTDA